jgi:hypothetical protein
LCGKTLLIRQRHLDRYLGVEALLRLPSCEVEIFQDRALVHIHVTVKRVLRHEDVSMVASAPPSPPLTRFLP